MTLKPRLWNFFNGVVFGFYGVHSGEVVRAGIRVAFAVCEHVPDCRDDGMLHCHDGFHGAAAGGDAPVFSGQVSSLDRDADIAAVPRAALRYLLPGRMWRI